MRLNTSSVASLTWTVISACSAVPPEALSMGTGSPSHDVRVAWNPPRSELSPARVMSTRLPPSDTSSDGVRTPDEFDAAPALGGGLGGDGGWPVDGGEGDGGGGGACSVAPVAPEEPSQAHRELGSSSMGAPSDALTTAEVRQYPSLRWLSGSTDRVVSTPVVSIAPSLKLKNNTVEPDTCDVRPAASASPPVAASTSTRSSPSQLARLNWMPVTALPCPESRTSTRAPPSSTSGASVATASPCPRAARGPPAASKASATPPANPTARRTARPPPRPGIGAPQMCVPKPKAREKRDWRSRIKFGARRALQEGRRAHPPRRPRAGTPHPHARAARRAAPPPCATPCRRARAVARAAAGDGR